MPKLRSKESTKAFRRMKTSKFRIGNAKGGIGGHSLSTEKLQEILVDSNKKRYRNNAAAVLLMRGVQPDFQLSS
jgi:hypothetical protein